MNDLGAAKCDACGDTVHPGGSWDVFVDMMLAMAEHSCALGDHLEAQMRIP